MMFDAIIADMLKWFSHSSKNTWLLIFDNVDSRERGFARTWIASVLLISKILKCLILKSICPKADQGFILITSSRASVLRLVGKKMRLELFNELQGEVLLNSMLEKPLLSKFEEKYT